MRATLALPFPAVYRRVQRFTLSSLLVSLHQGAHIVVADEKPALLEMMVNSLRSDDHCVFQAYDGMAALELALGLKTIDLLVTNTQMPGLSGPELIRHVRARLPALPILYIQNQGQPPITKDLPPDVPTLREPFTREELQEAVRTALSRGRSNPQAQGSL
ncbi:MAG TPA: response regulator [Gemmatimonadales bacterium]|jgi:two-component system cell cycle sensor histidine kinase/response regulator CckA|nr:response regulator [Gemmatimonadales bacterium]